MSDKSTKPTVFISYSREDARWAAALFRGLGESGVRGFLDDADLAMGADISSQMRGAMLQCDAAIVLCSPRSTVNPYVLQEIGMAVGLGLLVVPVVMDGEWDDPVRRISIMLPGRTCIDGRGKSPSELAETLAAAIQKIPRRGLDAHAKDAGSRAVASRMWIASVRAPIALLDAYSRWFPDRIANEEVGDALEHIHSLQAEDQPAGRVWMVALSTMFWMTLNVVRPSFWELWLRERKRSRR